MRTWKVGLGLLVVALFVFGVLVPLALPRQCPVNRAAFERIEVGMTVAEVEKILGGPDGDYRTEPPQKEVIILENTSIMDRRWWRGYEGEVEVHFDDTGCVEWKTFNKYETRPVGFAERLRWRLGRLMDRCLR